MPLRSRVRFVPAPAAQEDLFESATDLPEGMRYTPELISAKDEHQLIRRLEQLPFTEFQFHGFLGKRRTVSYGWHYDFNGGGLGRAGEIPEFLLPLREQAAAFAGVEADALEHALLIEYRPGAGIGWHKDRPSFGDVVGISLLSPCRLRLRRKAGTTWERRSLTAEPRSAYLLRGSSRTSWEHSIPPLESLRYSITFRTLSKRSK
jgi:alkylated DNA repair dioxygenase AlkB